MDSVLPIILNYGETSDLNDVPAITEAVKKYYFNNTAVTNASAQALIDVSISVNCILF